MNFIPPLTRSKSSRHPEQSFSLIQQHYPISGTERTRSWINNIITENKSNKPDNTRITRSGTKRKTLASIHNINTTNHPNPAAKRARGRPPNRSRPTGNECDKEYVDQLIGPSFDPPSTPDSIPLSLPTRIKSRSPSKQSSRTKSHSQNESPSKKSGKPDIKWIGTSDLCHYKPSIKTQSYQVAVRMGTVTPAVVKLWADYIRFPSTQGPIPLSLKEQIDASYNTPRKSQLPPDSREFSLHYDYNRHDLDTIFRIAQEVLADAADFSYQDIHEPSMSDILINPLLHLPRKLHRFMKLGDMGSKLTVLNISSVEIDPSSLLPIPEVEVYKQLNKKIDFVMALRLSAEDKTRLQVGTDRTELNVPSINQTSARLYRYLPMFLNVEIKREHAGVDPMIQLGIWIGAEYRKRVSAGYDRSMPVIAIIISGYTWEFFIAYEPNFKTKEVMNLVFLGPHSMGNLRDARGVYAIIHFMTTFADWGIKEYEPWFRQEILAKY